MFKTNRNWKKLSEKMENYTNTEMIEYLMKEGYQLVQGFEHYLISRAVFIINDHVVVKIAKNNCGVEQNWAEQQVYEQLQDHHKQHFAKLHVQYCIGGTANFMERVQTRKEDIKAFNSAYKQRFKKLKIHNQIANDLGVMYNMDLRHHTNFGIKNGRLVVLDYGCTNAVAYMYKEARKKHYPRCRWNDKNFGLRIV